MNLDSHQVEAFWENYWFLKDQDMTDEQIARRLNISFKTLEQRRLRLRKEQQ